MAFLSVFISNSYRTGLIFFTALLVIIFSMFLISRFLLKRLSNSVENKFFSSLALTQSVKFISRNSIGTTFILITLTLSLSFAVLIPQLRTSIENEILIPSINEVLVSSCLIFNLSKKKMLKKLSDLMEKKFLLWHQ